MLDGKAQVDVDMAGVAQRMMTTPVTPRQSPCKFRKQSGDDGVSMT